MKDLWGRDLNYVRISVTDRCNYRCRYCMPENGIGWIPHDKIMSYEDINFLIGVLRKLDVKKIRFTGGEPLVRKGMLPFLERVRNAFPDLRVALTTNGSTLTKHAPALARMRLAGINVSLDTLDAEKFSALTRGGSLPEVVEGIDLLVSSLKSNETSVKMNAVLIRGFNDGEVGALVDFAYAKGMTLRFIEFMPLDPSVWFEESFIPFEEALAKLPEFGNWRLEDSETNPLSGPARYYVNALTGQRLGVITAVSQHFCATCNRLRITSTGDVRSCLFSNEQISILTALRNRDVKELRESILSAACSKPEVGMTLKRDEKRHMSKIGG